MGFRFKNRQKAYISVEDTKKCCDVKVEDSVTKEEYKPVVILARLTEEGMDGAVYMYRVATSDGQVEIVFEESLLSEKDYNNGDETEGEAEKKEESPSETEKVV